MVAVDDTARHDALHALVPALSPHDHHAAAGIGALNALECLVGKGSLDGPPLLVDLFELGCEAPGLDGIAREQQVERERGVRHAPGGVKARYERERERVGGDRGEVRLAHAGERHIPRARRVAHLVDARGHERAVLGGERHHVRNSSERGHLEQAVPQVWPAQAAAQHLHELERDAGARKLMRGAAGIEFGVGERHTLGHHVRGLMMVGHHEVYAPLLQEGDLVLRGDAVIHRHDKRWMASIDHALKGHLAQAIPLVEAVRDEGMDLRPERTERLGEQARRGNAVDIEITEDRDDLPFPDGTLDAVGHLGHAGNNEGVRPVALKRRREEAPALFDRRDAVRDHDARHERGDTEPAGELVGEARVLVGDDPAMRGGKRCHCDHLAQTSHAARATMRWGKRRNDWR